MHLINTSFLDIDECLRELHDCDSTQRCEDTTDAYNCGKKFYKTKIDGGVLLLQF